MLCHSNYLLIQEGKVRKQYLICTNYLLLPEVLSLTIVHFLAYYTQSVINHQV